MNPSAASESARLRCGRFVLDLSRPRIMAVVNVTPDSFSGDGLGRDIDGAVRRAEAAIEQGAEILDIGGESSRPGSEPVSEAEELDRVVPLVERLAGAPVPISVDTTKPAVMRVVLQAGASMINDINAFRSPGAIDAVRSSEAALCVMHMQGAPKTMQQSPVYADVLEDVRAFLDERVSALLQAGVEHGRLILDPGFGFGKTLEHNLALLRDLRGVAVGGLPLLVGVSRKSMLGVITGRPVEQRLVAGLAVAQHAIEQGARIVRTHDVAATRDMIAVWAAIHGQEIAG